MWLPALTMGIGRGEVMNDAERNNQLILATDFLNAFRAEIIEECARVAELFPGLNYRPDTITKSDIAAAIRALKDKP